MMGGYLNCVEDKLIKAIMLPNIVWSAPRGNLRGTSFERQSPWHLNQMLGMKISNEPAS